MSLPKEFQKIHASHTY
ncbi:protein BIL1 [Kluyveromyces marxianus]|uniref:Protein BIL1 n=1 Tax=Kluyveromyces marxianus TaxID=4911 RepID=A0ABX6EQE7_KLUMA|nr:protein BIL1 [Kluyveromyces marxianus]